MTDLLIILWFVLGFATSIITCLAHRVDKSKDESITKWDCMLYVGFFIIFVVAGPLGILGLWIIGHAQSRIQKLQEE